MRNLVDKVEDCYFALGVVHNQYMPIHERFSDYIATPKPNGYQSLHTHLRASEGPVFEVQIRTPEMHELAEGSDGDAAHWRYKKAGRGATRAMADAGRGLLGRLFPRGTHGTLP